MGPPSDSGLGTGVLNVSCWGLTAGETYSVEYANEGGVVSLGQLTTNKKGELSATGVVSFMYYGDGWGAVIPVYVVNAAGTEVLQGTLYVR